MDKELTADQIIDALGGTSETARICEVAPPSVSDWRKTGIPHARIMFLRLARPDVFAALESQPDAPHEERRKNPQTKELERETTPPVMRVSSQKVMR